MIAAGTAADPVTGSAVFVVRKNGRERWNDGAGAAYATLWRAAGNDPHSVVDNSFSAKGHKIWANEKERPEACIWIGKISLEILRFLAEKKTKIRSTFFEKNLARESDIIYT